VETHHNVLRPTCRSHAGLNRYRSNYDIIHRDRFPDALKTHLPSAVMKVIRAWTRRSLARV
jgi:hypothetical protein